jgi:hypothetical protein
MRVHQRALQQRLHRVAAAMRLPSRLGIRSLTIPIQRDERGVVSSRPVRLTRRPGEPTPMAGARRPAAATRRSSAPAGTGANRQAQQVRYRRSDTL